MKHCIVCPFVGGDVEEGAYYSFTKERPQGVLMASETWDGVSVYIVKTPYGGGTVRLAKKAADSAPTTSLFGKMKETVMGAAKEAAPAAPPAPPPPPPASEPVAPAAVAITSKPPAVARDRGGKSGVSVFERGVGVSSWDGFEIGYELDLVVEVPVPATETAAAAVAEAPAHAASNILSRPTTDQATKSGAAVFGNGVGIASWTPGSLDAPEMPVASEAAVAAAVAAVETAASTNGRLASVDDIAIAAEFRRRTTTEAAAMEAGTFVEKTVVEE
jgi:hypothetical protein